ncbi:MAG: transporter permease [Thermomicrobiales bacterium]|nr:transporter permease [Thermomicrobiales bacterium]
MTLDYLINRRDRVWELTLQHINLSATAILIALLFAIPLGVLAARNVRISTPMLGILGAIYTIPSLAFLALLIPSLGIGRRATVAAWIGAGGLGTLLFEGITRDDPDRILAGAIAITALALLADAILRFAESMTAIARARRAGRG